MFRVRIKGPNSTSKDSIEEYIILCGVNNASLQDMEIVKK